jgi:hypothetical protein
VPALRWIGAVVSLVGIVALVARGQGAASESVAGPTDIPERRAPCASIDIPVDHLSERVEYFSPCVQVLQMIIDKGQLKRVVNLQSLSSSNGAAATQHAGCCIKVALCRVQDPDLQEGTDIVGRCACYVSK